MKHVLILFFLLSIISAKAGWVRGSITYNSGEEKTGYIKEFSKSETIFIEFRFKPDDKPVKIPAEEIKELVMRTQDGTLIAKYLYSSSIGMNGEYKTSKEKMWFRIVFRGEFDVLSSYSDLINSPDYYINWPGDNNANMIYIQEQNGVLATGKRVLLRKSMSTIFTNKCNTMVDSINAETFMPKNIKEVLKFYVAHCKENSNLSDKSTITKD
jgi:hypothetical protein